MRNPNVLMGIRAAAAGDFKQACISISAAVQADPTNEEAWLLLGHCLDDPAKRSACYQRVLEINPSSDLARISLSRANSPEASGPDPVETHRLDQTVGVGPVPPQVQARKGRPWLRSRLIGFSFVLLLVVLSASYVVSRVLNPHSQPAIYPVQSNQQPTSLADANTAEALRLMRSQDYAGAIKAWDQVIALAPQNDNAFYQRAVCFYSLIDGQNVKDSYLSGLRSAASDLQEAIRLRPDNLNYLLLRRQVLTDYAYLQELRSDRDLLFGLAAEDGRQVLTLDLPLAQALYLKRQAAENLIESGLCQEGLDWLQEVAEQVPTNDDFYGGVLMVESKGQACLGQLDLALRSIDASTFNGSSLDTKAYLKALYLYQAGRSAEALQAIDQTIQRAPAYAGWRYYLRAVLQAEMGNIDAANRDLETGAMYTWDRNGLYSYARAKLALASGDQAGSIQWLQHAEATLMTNAVPLRHHILIELADLNASPLQPTPSLDFPGLEGLTPAP